jgi:hypothetical protein
MSDRDQIRRMARRQAEPAAASRAKRVEHPVQRLQRLIGNAQVARMFVQREGEDEEEVQRLQRAPEDEEVQRAPEDEEVQRAPDEEEMVQTKADPGAEGGPVSDATASAISGMRGGGSPLDVGVQQRMEGAFDTSFADVRVHAGPDANALNKSLSSKAFTTGSDVFLGPGSSASDGALLAHELTHVVQQRSMSGGAGGMTAGPANDNYEQQADATARRIMDDHSGTTD